MALSKAGPVGGQGGVGFDDNPTDSRSPRSYIMGVQVNSGDTIDHLKVYYYPVNQRTSPYWVRHGQSNGGHPYPPFYIDVPNGERLVRVDGYIGTFDGTREIKGIRFATNRNRVSRLYGHATSVPFTFQAPPSGQIYAFFGRNGLFVDALGVRKSLP